jgi:hypothetical protein
VRPADIRWLLTATAPRIRARDAPRYRQLGLDEQTLRRAARLLERALCGGGLLTRIEAADALTRGGVDVSGQRLPYILMSAELDGLICSGPPRGAQHTHALLEERAPDAVDLPRAEAVATLARRFFGSHGPATAKDLVRWASLTLAEVRAALDAVGSELVREEIAGVTFWSAPVVEAALPGAPCVLLLQGYDEYVMGYSESKWVLARAESLWSPATPPVFKLVILVDGRVAGFWRRRIGKDRMLVEAAPFEGFGAAELDALEVEVRRYARFVGLPAALEVVRPGPPR